VPAAVLGSETADADPLPWPLPTARSAKATVPPGADGAACSPQAVFCLALLPPPASCFQHWQAAALPIQKSDIEKIVKLEK